MAGASRGPTRPLGRTTSLVVALLCVGCAPREVPPPDTQPGVLKLPAPAPVAPTSSASASPAPTDVAKIEPQIACRDQLVAGQLVAESCDGQRLLLAHPVELHPRREIPTQPTKQVLDAVAAYLESHPELLLVRIEARSGGEPRGTERARRNAVRASQRRADAVFHYLWRKRHANPERFESVGLGWDAGHARSAAYTITFVVVQRRPAHERPERDR